jgi:uncharacterized protein (TIGR02118 family)
MIKMTMFLKRRAGLSRKAFIRHHIEVHGPLFRSIPETSEHVLRYIQTHPLEEDVSPVENADFDGTAEIWFDSLAGLRAVLTSQTYIDKVLPDEKTFLDHANTLTLIGHQVEIILDQAERIAPKRPGKSVTGPSQERGRKAVRTAIIDSRSRPTTRRTLVTAAAMGTAVAALRPLLAQAQPRSSAASLPTSTPSTNGHYRPPFRFGLGGVALGNGFHPTPDTQALATLEAAWASGVRYFDTSPWYGLGLSERRFGELLDGQDRDDFVLSTKIGR